MTKPIRSYPSNERRAVVERRLKQNAGGLGTQAAKDAAEKYYSVDLTAIIEKARKASEEQHEQ